MVHAASRPDYRSTSRRTPWDALPLPVRETVRAWLSAPSVEVAPVGGGFTHGFAAVVSADNVSPRPALFVKATPLDDPVTGSAYDRETDVLTRMPSAVPVPALLHEVRIPTDSGVWLVFAMEAVSGQMPGHPWTEAEAHAIHESCDLTATHLTGPGPGRAGSWAGLSFDLLSEELSIPEHQEALNDWMDPAAHPAFWPTWMGGPPAEAAMSDLTRLFEELPRALSGSTLLNCDLRADNVIVADRRTRGFDAGTAWTCDWNWMGAGPRWADWVGLWPYLHAAGLSVHDLSTWPLTHDVDPEAIDSFLAGLATYHSVAGARPEVPTSPLLRRHGRFSARAALELLADRRRWRR